MLQLLCTRRKQPTDFSARWTMLPVWWGGTAKRRILQLYRCKTKCITLCCNSRHIAIILYCDLNIAKISYGKPECITSRYPTNPDQIVVTFPIPLKLSTQQLTDIYRLSSTKKDIYRQYFNRTRATPASGSRAMLFGLLLTGHLWSIRPNLTGE